MLYYFTSKRGYDPPYGYGKPFYTVCFATEKCKELTAKGISSVEKHTKLG